MFKKTMKKLKKAFTITELVIVIAVIAVLAAVLIPTFSNVVESSKKSSDSAFAKEINQTIAAYATSHGGEMPDSYASLMEVLSDEGLCDASNPYLLATALKQDDAYLIWFPQDEYTTSVSVIAESDDYVVTPISGNPEGLVGTNYGNGVSVTNNGSSPVYGYVLCTTGNSLYEEVASIMYSVLYTYDGDVAAYTSANSAYASTISNSTWASNITIALSNASLGYAYSSTVASTITDTLKTSYSVSFDLSTASGTTTSSSTQQETLTIIATLTALAADTSTDLSGKTITLNAENTVVDMSEVVITPIGTSCRKNTNFSSGAAAFSVDFGGLTLENYTVESGAYVSTGAEYQTASDLGSVTDGYAFTFGIFGSVLGGSSSDSAVTYSNLTVSGVNINLNGSTESLNGTTYNTVSDMAGVVCGYTQGWVNFKNITVIGGTAASHGSISGYDAVAGIVGRCYPTTEKTYSGDTVTFDGCTVQYLDVTGQRRASGLIGYAQNVNVVVKDATVTDCNITCARTDTGTQVFAGIVGCFGISAPITLTSFTYSGCTVTATYYNGNATTNAFSSSTSFYTTPGKTLSSSNALFYAVDGVSLTYSGSTYTTSKGSWTTTTA